MRRSDEAKEGDSVGLNHDTIKIKKLEGKKMKEHYEVDCRKCDNCDMENGCCKLYGSDPDKAVKACAADCFKGYTEKKFMTDNEDEYDPHTVAEAMCWKCGARWIAAFPSAMLLKELECPGCHNAGHAFLTGQDIVEDD